jgi:hypothetical protein
MKATTSVAYAATGLLLTAAMAFAQEKSGSPPGMQEAMKAAMPGPVHKEIEKRAGTYNTASKFTGPDGQAMESTGTAKIRSILGGRFLEEEGTGTLMGTPVQERRIWGYNNADGHYEAVWMYTMATGMMTLNGTSKDAGKSIHWTASYTDLTGKQTLEAITRFVSDDQFVVDLIAKTPDGKEGPHLETTYTRQK